MRWVRPLPSVRRVMTPETNPHITRMISAGENPCKEKGERRCVSGRPHPSVVRRREALQRRLHLDCDLNNRTEVAL